MIEPYLTFLSENAATLNWRFTEPAPATLTYGVTLEGRERITRKSDKAQQHRITLYGLLPDTAYHFTVENRYRGSFKTYGSEPNRRFTVVAHTHGTESFDHYPDRLLVGMIETLSPDFVVHAGDATFYNKPEGFRREFFDLFQPYLKSRPVYLAPGNHDAGWPFIYGPNPGDFESLFAYRYDSDHPGTLYHELRTGNLTFLFLSYTTNIGPGSPQRAWIAKKLGESDADFKIVTFGGAQKFYYDEPSLLEFLGRQDIDLIIRGDGFQPDQSLAETHGIPTFFTGTSGAKPHRLLYCDADPDRLRIAELNAAGHMYRTFWLFSGRKREAKLDLLKAKGLQKRFGKGRLTYEIWFKEPLSSGDFEGLQLRLSLNRDSPSSIHAYITPTGMQWDAPFHEGGFRTNHYDFERKDKLVTMQLPRTDPFKGGVYRFNRVMVIVTPLRTDQELEVEEMYLF